MGLGDDKLLAMLAKFGVDTVLVFHGTTYATKGVLDEVDSEQVSTETGGFYGRIITVIVKTGALPVAGLVEGAGLTVDGTEYTVLGAHKRDDGALTRVILARA